MTASFESLFQRMNERALATPRRRKAKQGQPVNAETLQRMRERGKARSEWMRAVRYERMAGRAWTYEELAKLFGLSVNSVTQWVRWDRRRPGCRIEMGKEKSPGGLRMVHVVRVKDAADL